MRTLEEITAEIEKKFPRFNWLVRREQLDGTYMANIYNSFAHLSFPVFASTPTAALEGALSRALEASISGIMPNEIQRL